MKEVLFVATHLTVGGVQKSLISALNSIDYTKNHVTLYVRNNRLDLLSYINKNVSVVVNDNKNHYYRKPKSIFLQLLILVCNFFRLDKKSKEFSLILTEYIADLKFQYEADKYFKDKSYDIAVSYWQGYNTLFVDKYIKAKKKIMFYQVSTDELHNIHQQTMPHYDLIVAEHQDIQNALYSWYNGIDGKVIVVDNYTDQALLKKMSIECQIDKHNKTIICTCARFSKVKGIDLAISSAKILKDKGFDFIWYFVGDGPMRFEIENLIKEYNLESFVVLTGMQKNPYPYIGQSDIFVQPSYEEALSIAMLEAQLLTIPVVSTKTTGGIAMIEDGINGFLSDIDSESLANTIEKLIIDNSLRLRIKNYLMSVDYSKEKDRYFSDWCNLLEV